MTQAINHTAHASAELDDLGRLQMLQVIEDAMRDARYCACGELMTVQAEGDTLWLQCPAFMEPATGRFAWLRGGVREFLHHREVITREVGLAA